MNPDQQQYQQAPGAPLQPVVAQAGPPGQPQPAAQPKANPTSTQNTLEIAEIRDGIVIMNDGGFRAVIACQSINFDLMSQQEREAVEFSYQGFLNSLYFDIQIFIRSQKVDLKPYIDKLDKIRKEHDNMLLALLMEDYIYYMTSIAQQTNIMDKRFYVIIPVESEVNAGKALQSSKGFLKSILGNKQAKVMINDEELERAKEELKNRVMSVSQGLMQCQVSSARLDTGELIELYYDVYNPDTATRQPLHNFAGYDADIVSKGKGEAPQPNLDREVQ